MKTKIDWSDLIIEEGKLDPLSLWRVGDRLADDLLGAFTTIVMYRPARYFAMYSWIFSLLQSRYYKTGKVFWRDFYQYETALLCAINLHERHNYDAFLGRIGSEYVIELIHSSKNGIIDVSNKKVRNGWEVNYKNPMYNFGLVETDPGIAAGLKLTSEGIALARAYGDSISESNYFRNYLDRKEIPIGVLGDFATLSCPCAIHNPSNQRLLKASGGLDSLYEPRA